MLTTFALRAAGRLRSFLASISCTSRADVPAGPPVVLRNLPGDHVWDRPVPSPHDPPPILWAHRSAAALQAPAEPPVGGSEA